MLKILMLRFVAAIPCFQRWTYAATSKHILVLLEARFGHGEPIVRKAALDAYSQIVGIRSSRDDNSGTSNGGSDELIGGYATAFSTK